VIIKTLRGAVAVTLLSLVKAVLLLTISFGIHSKLLYY